MRDIRQQIQHQKESNRASLKYHKDFSNHRSHQTALLLSDCKQHYGRVCVLGAGNCLDLELNTITNNYEEVHLVDIDREALVRARARLPTVLQKKVYLHSPIDLSCANNRLAAWRNMQVTPEELIEFPNSAVELLLRKLPAPFECVLSSCLASQLLLTTRHILGEQHPLFHAVSITMLITHLRLLVGLTKTEGRTLFVTDISSDEIAPFAKIAESRNGLNLLNQRASANQIFNYLDADFLSELTQQDPYFNSRAVFGQPQNAWLWNNGPHRTFLVYASVITQKSLVG